MRRSFEAALPIDFERTVIAQDEDLGPMAAFKIVIDIIDEDER